jgi:hypothetical protein
MAARKPNPNVLELLRSVQLVSVRAVSSGTSFLGTKEGDTLEQMKVTRKSGGLKSPDAPEIVRAMVGVECTVLARVGEDREVAKLSCDMALDYKVRNTELFERLNEDDCNQFAELNGVYNAWPYLREFCQSASLRMGLPIPIMLPTLSPADPSAPTEEKRASATDSGSPTDRPKTG